MYRFLQLKGLFFLFLQLGDQSLSLPAVGIAMISLVYVLVNIILVAASHIGWVTFLSSLTFINMITIPIKNVPQVSILFMLGFIESHVSEVILLFYHRTRQIPQIHLLV